jgi:hypothetical protein
LYIIWYDISVYYNIFIHNLNIVSSPPNN